VATFLNKISVVTFMNEKQSMVAFVVEKVVDTFVKKKLILGHILQQKLSVVTFMNEKQSIVTFVVKRVVATFVKNTP
jgi:uncharacterized membrane protein